MANSLSVPDTSSSGGTTLSAIVGDNPTPYGSAILGASTTDALTTGDLVTGDPGDFGLLAEFAVEFWFKVAGAFVGSDNTIITGPRSATAATQEWTIVLKAANNITWNVTDDGGTLRTATGATVLSLDTWYHVVATGQGGNLNLYINGALDGTTSAWSGHSVRALGAVVGSEDMRIIGPTVGGTNYWWDELAVYRSGLTASRVLAHYNAGVNRGFARSLPGARIGAILDTASSHAPRSIQTGSRLVIPRYMSGQAPVEEIRRSVEAEDVDAAFFAAADGTLVFLADGHRNASPYNTSQATFGDAGGAELAYVDLKLDYSPTFLINEWNVTRSPFASLTPITQTASDSTSISRYFKRSQSLSDVPTTQDSDALNIANALLNKYKEPLLRITQLTFNTLDPNVAEALFRRELMDQITVKRTPPGGGARISQSLWIQKIDITAANDGHPWTITWGVSPL